jgi:hypothetical protein
MDHTADATPVGVTTKDDLDPEALQKAFRFAAWSSIILVCVERQLVWLFLFLSLTCSCMLQRTASHIHYRDPSALIFCPNHLWNARPDRMGRNWDPLGVPVCFHRHYLPALRESGSFGDGFAWDGKGAVSVDVFTNTPFIYVGRIFS